MEVLFKYIINIYNIKLTYNIMVKVTISINITIIIRHIFLFFFEKKNLSSPKNFLGEFDKL